MGATTMASHTQVELKDPWRQRQPAAADAAPTSPTHGQKKSFGFFKRHLPHRRRSSSVSFPSDHSATSPTSPRHDADRRPDAVRPHSAVFPSRKLDKTGSDSTTATTTPDGTVTNDPTPAAPTVSGEDGAAAAATATTPATSPSHLQPPKPGGIKWAAEHEISPERARRPSANSFNGARRGSIYVRGAEGSYVEGVDAGAGSKARRLSVHIPDDCELDVDYCKLNEHFNVMARSTKKEIGEGGAAVVRLMQSKTVAGGEGGRDHHHGHGHGHGHGGDKVFAVKEFRDWDSKEEEHTDYIRKIKSEYAISKSCEHPNIVKTYRLCTSDGEMKWFHVMEYCDLGDLNDLIGKDYFSREDRNCMFKQLIRGVDYLHSRGLAHRDLKSENLLVSRTGCLKIADFGTAEVFSGKHPGLKKCRRPSLIDSDAQVRTCEPGLIGSRPYMAPEILLHHDYDPRAVDVWSCAIVYLTLCVGGTPWDCASTDVKNYSIYRRTWDEWGAKYPDGRLSEGRDLPAFVNTPQFRSLDDMPTKRLVLGMLHPDPAMRWSARQVLESKTVQEYPCCQQEGYSEDIRTRQRKAAHNHVPPKSSGKLGRGRKG